VIAVEKLEPVVQRRSELERERVAMEEKLDSVQRTQDLILEMLRQEPAVAVVVT
jgi:hypothetical protein